MVGRFQGVDLKIYTVCLRCVESKAVSKRGQSFHGEWCMQIDAGGQVLLLR